jgi:hypothetical protein
MKSYIVRRQLKKNIYVHNDLSNAAFHFKKSVEERLKENNREGIAFEVMACLSMLAFSFEARVNFLGAKLLKDKWRERQVFNNKVGQVFNKLNLGLNEEERPYTSIEKLKKFRDSIAHGKPCSIEVDEVVEVNEDAIEDVVDLTAGWEEFCDESLMAEIYEDMDELWKLMLSSSGLELFDTITHGSGGVTLIEKITDK